jgi:hypothetical protein
VVDWLVFAQAETARVDVVRLLRNARSYFPLSVDVLEELGVEPAPAGGPEPERTAVRLRVEWPERSEQAVFRIASRRIEADDLERARTAEARCRGGGLADLAARCRFVWELAADSPPPEPLRLAFTALLASVALGPILPPDSAAIYGVRGARERVDELTGGRRLTR